MSEPSLHTIEELPVDASEADRLRAQTARLRDIIDEVGSARVVEATELHDETVQQLGRGDTGVAEALDLTDAAAVLALAEPAPTADELVHEALDHLLFGMTAGVMNVDVVAGELDRDIEAREVQGMLEGRHPITLGEFVSIQHVIERRSI